MTTSRAHAGSPWLRRLRAPAAPRLRVICFPHAGGGASVYARWAASLPESIELLAVQPPGREERVREPLVCRMEDLVPPLASAIAPLLDERPTLFFGHSLGALVAFEVGRRLEAIPGPGPCHLVVSGLRAPHVPDRRRRHRLPDDRLLADIGALGGLPEELRRHPELLPRITAVLRGDLAIAETYSYAGGLPLACGVSALGGEDDGEVTVAELGEWQRHGRGAFEVRSYPGGHFYLHDPASGALTDLHRLFTRFLAPAT